MSKSKAYDLLCAQADALFLEHNPCKLDSNGKCADNLCFKKLGPYNYQTGATSDTGNCCGGHPGLFNKCEHLTKKGCRCKSLACKVWYCTYITKNYPELAMALLALKNRAGMLGVLPYAASRIGKVKSLKLMCNS